MKRKKVWIPIVTVVGLAVIAVLVIFLMKDRNANMASTDPQKMPVTVQKAEEKELTETILVTGEIVPEGEQKVYIEPDKGDIIEYKVAENQTVKAGDPLFLYDSSKLDVEYNGAVRERDLIKLRAKAEEAQIAELNKQIAAAKKNPSSESEAEIVDVNQLTQEKVQLELQYENTKSEAASAQERINEATNRKKEMTVVSKIDGIVVKVNQNIAKSETGASEPVIHIISNSPYKVIGTMSEFDSVKIQPGQAVVIRPKVYKDREWNGVVESVSQFPNEDGAGGEMMGAPSGGNVTMYPFKVAITDDTSELRQGFHVSLEVKIVGTEKKPVIPHSAILDEGGMAVAYVLIDGKIERREVKTGSMNDEWIQVLEGVNKDELVVIAPSEGMYDGMEVTSFDEIK